MAIKQRIVRAHSDIAAAGHDPHIRKVERILKLDTQRDFLATAKQRIRSPRLRQAILITQEVGGFFRVRCYNQGTMSNDLALIELAKAQIQDELIESWKTQS